MFLGEAELDIATYASLSKESDQLFLRHCTDPNAHIDIQVRIKFYDEGSTTPISMNS